MVSHLCLLLGKPGLVVTKACVVTDLPHVTRALHDPQQGPAFTLICSPTGEMNTSHQQGSQAETQSLSRARQGFVREGTPPAARRCSERDNGTDSSCLTQSKVKRLPARTLLLFPLPVSRLRDLPLPPKSWSTKAQILRVLTQAKLLLKSVGVCLSRALRIGPQKCNCHTHCQPRASYLP